jgi:hypothetical protein
MSITQAVGLLAQTLGGFDFTRIWESRNTTLLLGWILGVFTTPIAELVKDRRRKRQLEIVIRRELHEQQYHLALVSFNAECDYGDGFNRAFLVRTKELIEGYRGADVDPKIKDSIEKCLTMTDEQIAGYAAYSRAKDKGKAIPPFETRYLVAVMGDLRLFSPEFQTKLLAVRADLGKLNFHIQAASDYERFTFTVTDPGNHKAVSDNNRLGLRQVARLARRTAERIEALYPSGISR